MKKTTDTGGSLSYRAAGFAVMAALLMGLLLSLALRPPGQGAQNNSVLAVVNEREIRCAFRFQ